MQKLDTIIALVALSISTTILFQNCSGSSTNDKSSSFQVQGQDFQPTESDIVIPPTEIPETPVITGSITNRNFLLDNKIIVGAVGYATGAGDVFTYETNYLAQSKSTTATIQDAPIGSALVVDSDQCSGQKNLSIADIQSFFTIFSNAFPSTNIKDSLPNETQEANCAFPRLVMDASGAGGDLDLYFSPRECAPEGELFLADINNDNGDDALRAALVVFFRTHINDVCGL